MPFQPFQTVLANHRAVRLPGELSDDAREKLINKIAGAVRKQADLAGQSHGILRVDGEIVREENLILIPHEPATPLDPERIEDTDEHPDIQTLWWMSWAALDALKVAAAAGAPHGGIQSGTLYQDEAGRIKLGDLGIAPAIETICGLDARRQIHCDAKVQARESSPIVLSGTWALLDEDARRDHGWIAPYFAHELLEGKLRLNPKSDQFAIGTLLFLLATGTHPYGASLSDPTMMFYFHLEPYEVVDEREDWAEVFERAKKEVSGSADKPILAWSTFVKKLLASDSGSRFANPAEAEEIIAACVPGAWREAIQTIDVGLKALTAGNPDAFLKSARPLTENGELPAIWRDRLTPWVATVESQKEFIGRLKQLRQQLDDAAQALDGLDIEKARTLANEVRDAPEADNALRTAAQELLGNCTEQEDFVRTGADALARAYLESAEECLGKDELGQARQLLDGVLADPGTPPTRIAQARDLLAQVEAREQRGDHQAQELSGATEDIRDGRYDSARQRLASLLSENALPEALAEQARLLLEDVSRTQAERARCAESLERARQAWERADAEALEQALIEVPSAFDDREIADVRADLTERAERLRQAIGQVTKAEATLDDNPRAALALAEQTSADEQLPQQLRDRVDVLVTQCRRQVEQRSRELAESAQRSLEKAAKSFESGQVEACRGLLEGEVLGESGLPKADRQRAEALRAACDSTAAALTCLSKARERLEAQAFDESVDQLNKADRTGLPGNIEQQFVDLLEEIDEQREALRAGQEQNLAARLDKTPALIESGDLATADKVLVEVERSSFATDTLRQRLKPLRQQVDQLRPLLSAIEEIERSLGHDDADPAGGKRALDELPTDLPKWASARVEQLRTRAAKLLDMRRKHAIAAAREALDGAETALQSGNTPQAAARLSAAHPGLEFDEKLAARHRALSEQLASLAEWTPRVEAIEATLESGDVPGAHRESKALLDDKGLPAQLKPRVEQVQGKTKKAILDRRKQIESTLAELKTDLDQRGRRAKRFSERAESVKSDVMASKAHRTQADELVAAYKALPEPKPSRAPLFAVGGIVGVAAIGAALYFAGVFSPKPKPSPAVLIAARLQALQAPFAALAQRAASKQRERTSWTLAFDPPNSFPTHLAATAQGRAPEPIGDATNADGLDAVTIGDALLDLLWPPRAPERPLAERMKKTLDELSRQLADARSADDPDYALSFDPPKAMPASLVATNTQTNEAITLETISEAELDPATMKTEWLDQLLEQRPTIPERMQAALDRLAPELAQARANAMGDKPTYTLRFDPPDELPADLIARNAETGEDIRLPNVSEAQLDRLRLGDEQRRKLYPPPTVATLAEATESFLGDLRAALPNDVGGVQLLPDGNGFIVAVSWGEATLLPYANLTFDAGTGAFSASANDVATDFSLQIGALTALAASADRLIKLDAAYDGRFEVPSAQSTAQVTSVDSQAGQVALTAGARLANDPRPEAQFEFAGSFANGALSLTPDAGTAFAAYLTSLQAAQWEASKSAITTGLNLPDGFALTENGTTGGDTAAMVVAMPDRSELAKVDAVWNAGSLTYAVDSETARNAIGAGVLALAQGPRALSALQAGWPTLRDAVLASPLPVGAGYVRRCELVSVDPASTTSPNPFVFDADAAVAPADAAAGEAIRFAAPVRLDRTGLGWDTSDVNAARGRIQPELQRLSGDSGFRAGRKGAAVAALVGELSIDAGQVTDQVQGDKLTAKISGASPTEYEWTWDAAELAWGARREVNAPASLDSQLTALAAKGNVSATELAGALAAVAADKVARYGGGLGTSSLAGEADLRSIAQRAVRQCAPNPATDRYPTVFVEFYVGQQSVYGLSWRIQTNGGNVTGVTDTRVWDAMPTSELTGYGNPSSFLRAYTNNAGIGEKLLGPALGSSLAASGGNFGLMIAPDGALWMVRWEQVRFNARATGGITDNGADIPAQAQRMRDVLKGSQPTREDWRFARAGLWCVPSLGVESSRRTKLDLGTVVSGQGPVELSFTPKPGGLILAWLRDPSRPDNDAKQWRQLTTRLTRDNLGYHIWGYGWQGDNWNQTSYMGCSMILTP